MNNFPYIFSIIIPSYNEENRIFNSIKKIEKELENYPYEIIIVSDGSTDNTVNIVTPLLKENIKLIAIEKNTGKGYAVRCGFLQASGQYIVMTDADLSTPIKTLLDIEQYLDKYDIVIGSRLLDGKKVHHGPITRLILRKISKKIRDFLFKINVQDTQCGFKIFKNICAKNIASLSKINRYGADLEQIIIAQKLGYTIKEIAVPWIFDKKNSKINLITDSFKTLIEWLRLFLIHRK